MATAIKIYTTDANDNAMTKTIGNANPAVSDYVLKNFSEQYITLTNNTLHKVERVDTNDITDATEGGNITAIFKSSSPFFSDDSDTFTAAVNGLEGEGGNVNFNIDIALGSGRGASVSTSDWKSVNSLTNLVNLMNYKIIAEAPSYIKPVTFEKVTQGISGFNNVGYNVAKFTISAKNTSGPNGITIVQSLNENKIAVAGYTANYTESASEVAIVVTKN